MRQYRNVLLQCIFFLVFISNAYSQDIKRFAPQMQSINSVFSTASQDPAVNKIITDLYKKHSNDLQTSDTLNVLMQKEREHQAEVINELQRNSTIVQSSNNFQLNLSNQLKSLTNTTGDEKIEMNFLDLRLADAFIMLEAVSLSPRLTLDLVQHMNELAVDAANGAHSSSELDALNMEFQAYKRAINFAQTITILNGHKVVSGGDITIKFGANASDASTLSIKIPAFDMKSLMLDNLNIQTTADAVNAIGSINTAISTLVKTITIISGTPVLKDAEAMILSMPYMLYQNFVLLVSTRDISMQAMNGTYSDSDRELMNIEFDYLKAAMERTQTYLSLSGAKMIGGGNIHLQIGNELTPYNTLQVDLPATDIKKIGMDKLNIKTFESTKEAFSAILKNMYDFAYLPASNMQKH